ncbi:MAG: PHP domain-containing protein [Clostridia bacterium]|nr:PHP domain-containing protein [Clostridia bacterium]MBP5765599.1 PHP domain-containing protein [Clostridia bacterium]
MKTVDLFPGEGSFYKANLHCHSTYSDGRLTVEQLKDAYKAHGYGILAYSDHNTLTPHNELTDDGFLALNAIEIDYNMPSEASPRGWAGVPVYHLNFFSEDKNRTEFIPFERVYDIEKVQKTIDDANAAGFLAMYNHPRWSFQGTEDFAGLKGLFGFEVFNTGCEVDMANGWGDYEYEYYCRAGGDAAATATDDNHMGCRDFNSPHMDCFGGFSMIKAKSLSYEDVFDAMRRKNLYASTGPLFTEATCERLENGAILVKGGCSPCRSVFCLTDSRASANKRSWEKDITSFEFTIPGDTIWFRLEAHDGEGHKAMTKAYRTSGLV